MIEVPETVVPRPVAQAAKTLREREHELEAARQKVREATAQIELAIVEDRAALADALDRGEVAGTAAEDQARRELAEAERLVAANELRCDRAREAFEQALHGSVDGWTTALTKSIRSSEQTCLRLVDELEAAERERARERVALSWLRRYASGAKLPPLFAGPTATSLRMNQNSPATFSIVELLEHVRTGLREATIDAESERDAAAAAQAEADDAGRARLLGLRQSMS